MNAPKLRFPEFSGAWPIEVFASVVERGTDRFNPAKEEASPILIELENLESETGIISGESDLGEQKSIKNVFNSGDVLFGKLRPYLKKFAHPKFAGVCSSEIWVLKGNGILNDFLFYFIQGRNFLYLANLSSGSKMPRAEWQVIAESEFFFPEDENEQQKIAAFLGAVDAKIGQLARKKALLEDSKKGCMGQLFTQKLRFKDDQGNDFPDWEEKKLGDVLTIGSGRDYKHLGAGNIPVYGTGGYMLSVDDYLYDGESVCIGRKGTIDSPALLNGKFWTVDTLFYTHSYQGVLPRFIFAIFQQINWAKYNEASGVPSLSKATIEQIAVGIPHPDEQRKIADFLSVIDAKISLVADELSAAQDFKKGLLQHMFV